jgi:hypothetical protein
MEVNTVDLLISQFPTMAGLIILAFVLWKLLNDTMNNLLERIKFLEQIIIRLLDEDEIVVQNARKSLRDKLRSE